MKSLKTILLGATLTAGLAIFFGASNASADTLYTIKSGDTLSTISQQFKGDNSLINSIAQKNNVADINMIYVGEQLTIPTDGQAVATTTTTTSQSTTTQTAAAAQTTTQTAASTYTGTSSSAKEWIAQRESSGSYTATNGRYIGRYQLDSSYLNGDYSAANQERVADNYVAQRYGSWEAAQSFWMANGWY